VDRAIRNQEHCWLMRSAGAETVWQGAVFIVIKLAVWIAEGRRHHPVVNTMNNEG